MSADHPTVLNGADDHEKLQHLCSLPYKNQAIWFLNGEPCPTFIIVQLAPLLSLSPTPVAPCVIFILCLIL